MNSSHSLYPVSQICLELVNISKHFISNFRAVTVHSDFKQTGFIQASLSKIQGLFKDFY